ncbi:MAG TPA: MFS transporter [Solirubrobacteraceae bacterium]|nr:MFS transporter [Solirubrobacteraceae bacterium]
MAERGAGAQLAAATAAFTVCFYAWALLGPLGPDLQDELALSDLELSIVVAVPVLLGSLMRIPLGALTDRYGGRRVFTALLAYTPLPLIALALFHASLGVILLFGFLLGFAGASFAVGVPFVNRWYPPERQGAALGIYGMGMGGTVLAGLTAPAIADELGISAPFWLAGALVALTAVGFYAIARDAPGAASGATGGLFAPLAVFRTSGRAWALTLFYFLAFGGFVAMFLYLPKLLTGVHDLTKTDAGARAAGFALLAVLARPMGGWLADRVGAARVLRVSFAGVTLLAAALAATYESMVPLTVACLSLAVFLGLGTGAVFKLVAEWFPERVGAVTGVVGAAGGLGGFFPPLVMGIVKAATGGYALGFALMALVAVACLLVLARLTGRTAPREQPPRREPGRREPAVGPR